MTPLQGETTPGESLLSPGTFFLPASKRGHAPLAKGLEAMSSLQMVANRRIASRHPLHTPPFAPPCKSVRRIVLFARLQSDTRSLPSPALTCINQI